MPENIISRTDIAAQHAAERNGPMTLTIQGENFASAETPIYFYNVSELDFNTPRPPNHPHMYIRPCPKGQRYVMARGSIVHPFHEVREDQNENKFPVLTNGFKEATKMMYPLNPGTDQDFSIETDLSIGDNLNEFGVFWSTNNPPTDEEVDKAVKRMEGRYRRELERMGKAKTADEALQMRNRISAAAANYFNVSTTWHQSNLVSKDHGKVECGACGELIQPTARLCKECGAPTNPAMLEDWMAKKFEKRGPGRPPTN